MFHSKKFEYMKNNIFRYSGKILLGALIATGCSDYLKEDSGDLLIPKKVEEYSPMLYAEGYPSLMMMPHGLN